MISVRGCINMTTPYGTDVTSTPPNRLSVDDSGRFPQCGSGDRARGDRPRPTANSTLRGPRTGAGGGHVVPRPCQRVGDRQRASDGARPAGRRRRGPRRGGAGRGRPCQRPRGPQAQQARSGADAPGAGRGPGPARRGQRHRARRGAAAVAAPGPSGGPRDARRPRRARGPRGGGRRGRERPWAPRGGAGPGRRGGSGGHRPGTGHVRRGPRRGGRRGSCRTASTPSPAASRRPMGGAATAWRTSATTRRPTACTSGASE